MVIHEKPDFVYTGQKDFHEITYYNVSKTAKMDDHGNFIAVILLDNCRIDIKMKTLSVIIDYAKKKIVAKGKRGARNAYGKCKILLVDEKSSVEFTAAVINLQRTRYYEPINRFEHLDD